MDFNFDHVAFEEAKKSLNTQIGAAVKSMLQKQAGSCTITMKLEIERPEILDVLMNPDDYIGTGEELRINHNVSVKVSFEYNKKGCNQNRVAMKREPFGDYSIECYCQESMFDREDVLNE